MSARETILLFAGPVLAGLVGVMFYVSGPLFDRWEAWRIARNPKA